MSTGMLSWCALVAAPLSSSAACTVLVCCLAPAHPLDGSPLEWGAEVRVPLREALRSGQWAALSGTIRFLEYPKACPLDPVFSSRVDRQRLRHWAAKRLRKLGAAQLHQDDRLDSLLLMTHARRE